jgi:photosystem II stability/assembly factor-like uncharacterized protein
MLVLLSPTSVNSDNVRDEVSFALGKQKRIIPLRYLECDVPFRLARLQHVDFRADYNRALQALLKSLGVEYQRAGVASSSAPSTILNQQDPKPVQEVQTNVSTEPAASHEHKELPPELPGKKEGKHYGSEPEVQKTRAAGVRQVRHWKALFHANRLTKTILIVVSLVLALGVLVWSRRKTTSLNDADTKKAASFSEDLSSITFVKPQFGWAVGKGIILHTTDAGRSWSRQGDVGGIHLNSVNFVTPESGWAVGESGTILHTSDAGISWQKQPSGSSESLTAVAFVTTRLGWAVGRIGTILHTDDGGASWEKQSSSSGDADLLSVAFPTPQLGWAVGDGLQSILRTTDGGQHWQKQNDGTAADLTSVFFSTPKVGWVVGGWGTILHSQDGGGSWQVIFGGHPPLELLNSITFVNDQYGWAVGPEGLILCTVDGGHTWKKQDSGTRKRLKSVAFLTPKTGWAVGYMAFLHTQDGGHTWQEQRQ